MPESAMRPRTSKQQMMADLSIYVSMEPHKCHIRCRERDPWRVVILSQTSWELIDSIIRDTLGTSSAPVWNGLTLVTMLERIVAEQRRLLCLEIPRRAVRHDFIVAYSRSTTNSVESRIVKEGFQKL